MPAKSLDQVVAYLKQRGFIFQSSEIYGGAAASYDYGPLGVELKNAIKRSWWRAMTMESDAVVGLDAAIFMHPRVWEASGHVSSFSDPLVECLSCHKRFRADHLLSEERFAEAKGDEGKMAKALGAKACPHCGKKGQFSQPRNFNLMFSTMLGTVEGEGTRIYLRPETCQGIYADAQLVAKSMRLKVPFGIAQIGKAFRNEITPGNFTFRTVEFEQMEMQFFVKQADAAAWFETWKKKRMEWYAGLGFGKDSLRFREHRADELAHYAKAATDVEYKMPMGWKEIEGIHNRGDWDLSRHAEYSGKDLSFFDEETKEKFIPWIIETSVGADRLALAVIMNALTEENDGKETRRILRLPFALSPVEAAVFPLLTNDEGLQKKAGELFASLRGKFRVQFDDGGSIGRRYRRQDEIGTPFCFTVDHQTLADGTITVRSRDTMEQERISAADAEAFLKEKLAQ